MPYTQKYTLVSLLHPTTTGTEFAMTDWPLHITLADVFAINLNKRIIEGVANLARNQPPISLIVGEDATLGTTRVSLIEKNTELHRFHNQLIDLLESHGAVFNTPEFTRTGFLPHISVQSKDRLAKGDHIQISAISLIDMFPGGDWQQRKVLNSLKLATNS